MTDMCRSQKHDKDQVGRDPKGRCRGCLREASNQRKAAERARKCQASHPFYDCEPYQNAAGATLCRRRADQVGLKNTERSKAVMARRSAEKAARVTDGLEDEFGPVPPRDVGLEDWVDSLRQAEAAAKALEDRPWYAGTSEAAEARTERLSPPLRSSSEGHLGSAYQPPGKRPTVRTAKR